MEVKQFYDKGLAQSSYAIVSDGEMALVDPARDPQPFYDYADEQRARITAIFETHPHADFVSGHKEIAEETGATIYVSKLLGADYPHQPFDEGDEVKIGKVTLQALNTPGHSPDSVTILLQDENGKDHAVFTGDTLFVGDVGRPDLREKAGNIQAKREALAQQMYHSVHEKLSKLDDDVLVYPAHGPGSLCGKNISDDLFSTIGREKSSNYAFQMKDEAKFVKALLEGQPWIPKYFPHEVSVNKAGAPDLEESLQKVPRIDRNAALENNVLVVDARPAAEYQQGHLEESINIPDDTKFETWLGTLLDPEEPFYLIAGDEEALDTVIYKAAKIGYEGNIKGALLTPDRAEADSPRTDVEAFKSAPGNYTVVDVRTAAEAQEQLFANSLNIPLSELRERSKEVPADKPVMVHCAGGYRSAIGSSILGHTLGNQTPVYDLSEAVKNFQPLENA